MIIKYTWREETVKFSVVPISSYEDVVFENSSDLIDSYIVERKILEMRRGCSIKCQNIICFVFKYIHECISTIVESYR